MIEVIAGTDRPNSNSSKIAHIVHALFQELGVNSRVMDLATLNAADVAGGRYFQGAQGDFKTAVDRVGTAHGLVVVVPEYNGSYPGFLKLFIDYWKYPESFEHRPIALIGLGGRWGGLRPVEHLQQVFGYRNSYVFPNRVFLSNVKDLLRDGTVSDPFLIDLLKTQAREFVLFIEALQSKKLDAISRRQNS